MGVVQNIVGMVRDIHDRQENAKIRDVLKDPNNLNNPDAAYAAAYQISPEKAMVLKNEFNKQAADQAATDTANFKAKQDRFNLAVHMLRGIPQDQLGAGFDRMAPLLTGELGLSPDAVAQLKANAMTSPDYLPSLDDKAYEQMTKDDYTTTVATPGSHALRGGKVIDQVPVKYEHVTVGSPQTGYTSGVFDPNTGTYGAPADRNGVAPAGMTPGSAAPAVGGTDPGPVTNWTTESLLPHFKQQESHGDYTQVNRETGALGAYQIMPPTGRALAAKLGMAWRPDMMHKNDPISMKYQDALGHAAVQEAVVAGGGDPDKTFAYYHSGPDQSGYGPKTAQYVADMKKRVGLGRSDGQGATVTPEGITVPAAPAKRVRAATKEEVAAAGYPEGTAAQVDETGKFVNLKEPGKQPAPPKGTKTPVQVRDSYRSARQGFEELRRNIEDVINDPDLGYATGMTGKAMHFIKGTTRQKIEAKLNKIRTQKLMAMVSDLQSHGGSPFTRITNYEAQILPTTLGDFNLDQSTGDLINTGKEALKQIAKMEADLDAGAKESGLVDEHGRELPMKGDIRKGHRYLGGDPASPSSWEKVQ